MCVTLLMVYCHITQSDELPSKFFQDDDMIIEETDPIPSISYAPHVMDQVGELGTNPGHGINPCDDDSDTECGIDLTEPQDEIPQKTLFFGCGLRRLFPPLLPPPIIGGGCGGGFGYGGCGGGGFGGGGIRETEAITTARSRRIIEENEITSRVASREIGGGGFGGYGGYGGGYGGFGF
jgi:hypothetical protein